MKNKTLREEYLNSVPSIDYIDDNNGAMVPHIKPKYNEEKYIGIEIECLINDNSRDKFIEQVYKNGLESKLMYGDDGSIEEDYSTEGVELRLLTTEKSYKNDLKALADCLRVAEVYVNDSCGTHVHLDTKHMTSKKIVSKLIPFKSLFQSIVPDHRKNNEYCEFGNNYSAHHNWLSYNSIGTVEIRCHEGTVNMKAIERFINLLLAIKEVKLKKGTKNLLNVLKLSKSDKAYFQKRMNHFDVSKGDKYYV